MTKKSIIQQYYLFRMTLVSPWMRFCCCINYSTGYSKLDIKRLEFEGPRLYVHGRVASNKASQLHLHVNPSSTNASILGLYIYIQHTWLTSNLLETYSCIQSWQLEMHTKMPSKARELHLHNVLPFVVTHLTTEWKPQGSSDQWTSMHSLMRLRGVFDDLFRWFYLSDKG